MTMQYDEVVLGRWIEERIRELGIRVIVGAVIQSVEVHDGRIDSVSLAPRYGTVTVQATGFVDSTGDVAPAG
jgi:FAD dependent oxidoreductase